MLSCEAVKAPLRLADNMCWARYSWVIRWQLAQIGAQIELGMLVSGIYSARLFV